MTPDDARAAIGKAIPCTWGAHSSQARCYGCEHRAAVWPIIEKIQLETYLKGWNDAATAMQVYGPYLKQVADLEAKLAAAEARIKELDAHSGRDPRALDDEPGTTSELIESLRMKLAQAEADLAACQNVVRVVNAQNDALTIRAEKAETERDELNDLLNIAEQGGACAK